MALKEDSARSEAATKLLAFVLAEIKQGTPRGELVNKLTDAGVGSSEAIRVVDSVQAEVQKAADQEVLTPDSLILALLGGVLAAIAGGLIWGLIVIATDYEIGFMATGIGVLAGFAVAGLSGKRGLPLQIVAVLASLAGILVGRYLTFFSVLRDFVGQEHGAAAVANVKLFSSDVLALFLQSFTDFASPYDILWVILAIVAAWRIPRGLALRPGSSKTVR